MIRPTRTLALTLLIAVGAFAFACGQPGDGTANEGTAATGSNPTPILTFVPYTATATLPPGAITTTTTPPPGVTLGALDSRRPEVGQPAPDFQLQTSDLKEIVRLSELQGKPVVVNFWASWCGPCRAEMPDIQEAFDKSNGAFHVIGVNEREPDLVARGFAYNLGVTFPLLLDLESSVGAQYGLLGLPATFFVDADGVIRDLNQGYMSAETLETRLRSVGVEVELD